MERTSSRRLVLLVTALLLFSTACGARLSNAQKAALAAGANGNPTANPQARSNGGATATTTPTAAASNAGGAAGGGTGPVAAGGDNGGGGGGGGACTPAPGATDPGVTDSEVRLGNVSTMSGPIPNFGQTGVNGVKAYFNYVNQTQGGVCGRQLKLLTGDDRLDAGQSRAVTEQLSSQVLGFVGDTTVVDNGAAAALQGTNIANTSLSIGDAAIASPNFFSPNPIDPSGTTSGTVPILNYFKSTRGITKVAVVYPAQADARARANGYIKDIQAAGLALDGPYEVAIAETNYNGVATKIKNDGADAFITALEINGMSRFAQALQQIGYTPKVAYYGAQAYGKQFINLAGSAAEGATIGIAYSMFEDPSMQNFNDWYARTNPGSDPDFFSIMGWAAADMYVQALEQAGPVPTRDKVLAALQNLHQFDAHGVLGVCDPAGKHASPQFLITTVSGGAWKRFYPDSGFATS